MSKITSFFKLIGFSTDPEPKKQPASADGEPAEVDPEQLKDRRDPLCMRYGKNFEKAKFLTQIDSTVCKRTYDPSKKDLILDLDNTLVCASLKAPPKKHVMVKVEKYNRDEIYYVIPRPGLHRALNKLVRSYNISVFTAGASLYARKIICSIGIGEYIYKIYDRDSCMRGKDGRLIKNVWNFDFEKEKTVFVDDSTFHVGNHEENGLLIKPFHGAKMDRELLKVADFLDSIAKLDDVRNVGKNYEHYLYESRVIYEEEMMQFQQEDDLGYFKTESDQVTIAGDIEMKYSKDYRRSYDSL